MHNNSLKFRKLDFVQYQFILLDCQQGTERLLHGPQKKGTLVGLLYPVLNFSKLSFPFLPVIWTKQNNKAEDMPAMTGFLNPLIQHSVVNAISIPYYEIKPTEYRRTVLLDGYFVKCWELSLE